jgi:hypothetical protein
VKWISISSFPDIYFRIFVQFNQLFVTIICFWRHKNLNCMHDDKFWAFRFLYSVLVTMETSYNTMCARKIRQSRTWASQPFFFTFISFLQGKIRTRRRRSLNTPERKKKNTSRILACIRFCKVTTSGAQDEWLAEQLALLYCFPKISVAFEVPFTTWVAYITQFPSPHSLAYHTTSIQYNKL